MNGRWRQAALLAAFALVVFQLGRAALWLGNPGDFAALAPGEVLSAWLAGLRFDASILAASAGPLILLLALPAGFAAAPAWRRGLAGLLAAVLGAWVLVLGADAVYFRFVHRHLGQELLLFFRDPAIAAASVGEFWLPALAGALVIAALAWAVLRVVRTPPPPVRRPLAAWGLWLVAAGLLVLAVRGSLAGKPIQAVNAYAGRPVAAGNLALNGPFVAVRSRAGRMPEHAWLPPAEAAAVVDGLAPGRPALPGFPLARPVQPAAVLPPATNVLLVLVESFGAQVGALRAADGLPPGDATPCFDRLAGEGRFFTRFHANGQRSMEGIAAVLAGVPTMPGLPYIGEGLEQNRLAYLGGTAKANGWSTFFIQGSVRSSYRVDAIAALAGFERYQGAQDIPFAEGAPARRNPMGAHDDDTLHQALRLADEAPKPFFGMAFTLSTHGPYATPDPRWDVEDGHQGRYRNSLRYADWAIGRLVEGVRARPWGRDTLIVIVADHAWQDEPAGGPAARHRVPLLLLHPAIPPAADHRIASQADLGPTLMDLCGWRGVHTGIGRSLADPAADGRGALVVAGEQVTWVDAGGWVQQQGGQVLAEGGDAAGAMARRRTALGVQQVLIDALWRNRVLPP